jgi:hypothetical protein
MRKKIFDPLGINFRFLTFDWIFHPSSIVHHLYLLFCVFMISVLTGCQPQMQKEEPLCAGKPTAAEAIGTLRQKQAAQLSLQAAVHCDIEIANPQGKPNHENFNGKMVFAGPDNLRIGGDKFGPIQIGANAKEFWFYVKPGLDTAWWGEKKIIPSCAGKLGFNPSYLAEALGQIDLDRDWTLTQEPGIDILTAQDADGIRKVSINCCTYQIERIEYCDIYGNRVASADLSDYRDVPKAGRIPQAIELRHFRTGKTGSVVRLRLSAISSFTPKPTQQKLFERPVPKGYKSVYRWTQNCEFTAEE